MSHSRRKSRDNILAVQPSLQNHDNGELDLTARTKLRRKGSNDPNEGKELNKVASMPILTRQSSQEQNTPPLSRVNSMGDSKTPRRRGSRSGSISGLTASQALTLSAQYGAEMVSTNTNSSSSGGSRRGSFTGTSKGDPSPTHASGKRRGSYGGSTSHEDSSMIALKRRGSFSGMSQDSPGSRRGSFSGASATSTTGSAASSRRGSREQHGDGNVCTSNHNRAFEVSLIQASIDAVKKYPGRSISSIKANPRFGKANASSQRGVTLITKNICLGGRDDASDISTLRKYGITHVLNVAIQLPNFQDEELVCMKIPVHDTEDTDLSTVFPIASAFISRAEEANGRVLVHCISGVSRSTTIVVMHLMKEHGMILKDAYGYVHSCRPWIGPNDGFKLQLARMEVDIFGGSSVSTPNCGAAWNFYAWNAEKASVKQLTSAQRDRASGSSGCFDSILEACFGS